MSAAGSRRRTWKNPPLRRILSRLGIHYKRVRGRRQRLIDGRWTTTRTTHPSITTVRTRTDPTIQPPVLVPRSPLHPPQGPPTSCDGPGRPTTRRPRCIDPRRRRATAGRRLLSQAILQAATRFYGTPGISRLPSRRPLCAGRAADERGLRARRARAPGRDRGALEARGTVGRAFGKVKRIVIGAPLTTAQAAHERLTKAKALAVLSSDALSSVAYATEEILRVLLVTAGIAAMTQSPADRRGNCGAADHRRRSPTGRRSRPIRTAAAPISSPRTTSASFPSLTAAAALLIDYILTVSVSIAAAVAAMVFRVPRTARLSGLDRHRHHRARHAAQSARHPRVGPDLRRAHLSLHGRHVRHARHRARPQRRSTASSAHPPPAGSRRAGRDRAP